MTISALDIQTLQTLPGGGQGNFTHKMQKGLLPNSATIWFCKEMESPAIARLELLSQEFYRLLIPIQPKTSLAINTRLNTYYILSEAIPSFRPLPKSHQNSFVKGCYPGLGNILVAAILLHEIDLKNGNVGLNNKNQVVKIDGDWCFVGLKNPNKYAKEPNTITAALIKSLPFPSNFYTYNWLDFVRKEASVPFPSIIDHRLSHAPSFRQEVNQTILKALVMPHHYLKKFVATYIPLGVNSDRFLTICNNAANN